MIQYCWLIKLDLAAMASHVIIKFFQSHEYREYTFYIMDSNVKI